MQKVRLLFYIIDGSLFLEIDMTIDKTREEWFEIQKIVRPCPVDIPQLDQVIWKELIAIEIETGKSDAIRNIRKDLKAGFDRVVVACLDPKLKEKITNFLGAEEMKRVDFLFPSKEAL